MINFFDSHAHITSETLFPQVEAILERAFLSGVNNIVNVCTDIYCLMNGIDLSKRYPTVYNAAAIHPHDAGLDDISFYERIVEEAQKGNLIAIGETGLDYHYQFAPREKQKESLRQYLRLAKQCQLPIIIHCREAFHDLFEILDQEYKISEGRYYPGVLHCFTGNQEEADHVVAHGLYLSLSGVVTFKKSQELQAIAKTVPLEQLLIETDCPFLAPQSKRGKQNEPAFLPETATIIASLKNIPLEELAQITTQNAENFFALKKTGALPKNA